MLKRSPILLLNIFCLLLQCNFSHISKRSLLFPRATVLQFTIGLSVPLILPKRSINFSICMQANYNLPYNLSNFEFKIIRARVKETYLDLTREIFYKYMIEALDSIGLNGEQCLLRSICEISEIPMHSKNEGLLEKIVHYIFTPSLEMETETENENATNSDNLTFTDKLLVAEKIGRHDGNCNNDYSDCILSIVDMFTEKYIM